MGGYQQLQKVAYEYAVVVKRPEFLQNCNKVSLKDHNINYNMIGDISNDLFFSQCCDKKFP